MFFIYKKYNTYYMYKNKYLKYKNKYLNLISQIGGECSPDTNLSDVDIITRERFDTRGPDERITINGKCYFVNELYKWILDSIDPSETGSGPPGRPRLYLPNFQGRDRVIINRSDLERLIIANRNLPKEKRCQSYHPFILNYARDNSIQDVPPGTTTLPPVPPLGAAIVQPAQSLGATTLLASLLAAAPPAPPAPPTLPPAPPTQSLGAAPPAPPTQSLGAAPPALTRLIPEDKMPYYQTEIIHDGPIYTLSDIHGDIHSFIITLRDCAKVITKETHNRDILDPDIDTNLNIDISVEDNGYNESLGYRWNGGNAHIVICGDFIDPNRKGRDPITCSKRPCPTNGHPCNCIYYPQSEIKLLRLINELNRQAREAGGRIIKLLGNHEVDNILNDRRRSSNLYYNKYTFEYDRTLSNYYRGQSRKDIFKIGNLGFNLLFQDTCGILVKINNTIFVHGQLTYRSLLDINNFNQSINHLDNIANVIQILEIFNEEDEMLRMRNWGTDEDYHNLIDSITTAYPNNHVELVRQLTASRYCDNIRRIIIRFLGISPEEVNKYRVVIGHCPQNEVTYLNEYTTTFQNLSNQDDVSKTYNGVGPLTQKPNIRDQNTVNGITMGCQKPTVDGLTDFLVYRVDIGSSREFDQTYEHIYINYQQEGYKEFSPVEMENKILFSKTPQLLAINRINDNDVITIIKSKMWNTRIHLPRFNYESIIRDKTTRWIRPNIDQLYNRANYDNKYLKTKKK